ncbi:hypothetical protein NDU88_007855 [Pleurodeles waltl]|uniref:Uncharacterized protein n=1 Tax=Pleurodeles waltl TaxID=8319 RepID=A0AAV7PQ82_PLEWA|nr:hypothetical protein NDU88_007855 [Pleurodeles waltl]
MLCSRLLFGTAATENERQVGKLAAAVVSALLLGLNAVPVSGLLPTGRWLGPLVSSLQLRRLRVAEARPLLLGSCFLR